MKFKILSLTFVFFLFSCGTKKQAVTATSEPVTEAPAIKLTAELAEEKNLYENSCAKCHKLYEPKKFTQEEWKPILVRMQKKAHLDDTQIVSISNYINSQL